VDENAWLNSTDPPVMLDSLRTGSRKKDRKFRLFACGCCRLAARVVMDEVCLEAVDTAERHADGQASPAELDRAAGRMADWQDTCWRLTSDKEAEVERRMKMEIICCATRPFPFAVPGPAWEAARLVALMVTRSRFLPPEGRCAPAALLRCIFGNPFRPITALLPDLLQWRAGLVVRLAQAAYEHRVLPAGTLEPDRLSVLADGLEEAGGPEEVIRHLRDPGAVHVRGCWVLDLVLGRT
jgi:hypothetical protein